MSGIAAAVDALKSPLVALRAVEVLCGISVALQAMENLANLPALRETGTWRWSVLSQDFARLPRPMLRLLERVMSCRALLGLSLIQLSCALAMLAAPRWWWPVACFNTSLIFALRWRGSVNGGSDSITLITLACLTLGRGFVQDGPVVLGALLYVALQAIASYLIAGVVKFRSSHWRDGRALRRFIEGAAVGPPPEVLARLLRGRLSRAASFGVISFELSAPFTLISPHFALVFVSAGLMFHGLNAYLLGLHRFFLAWLATYPAIMFAAALLL